MTSVLIRKLRYKTSFNLNNSEEKPTDSLSTCRPGKYQHHMRFRKLKSPIPHSSPHPSRHPQAPIRFPLFSQANPLTSPALFDIALPPSVPFTSNLAKLSITMSQTI
ncbi:hypothetical protein GWI33_001471 [Rhynchophorus ferrugineus]|uniref:Uncharacterized protein n=1 Tax=Rhynchophorus ferrugineus TaxID=354439 RepID=A0A834MLS3_RHYFE|nr:hypothetical protein GWI33_001471 [Rhynchophorus ferrugineus]